MKCQIIRLLSLFLVSFWLSACGGGGGGGSSTPPPPPPPPAPLPATPINGVFKDSNVEGLAFTSGQQSGVTDGLGRYTCESGANISFSIRPVTLGQAECATLIMPPALTASGEIDDPQSLGVARFLQMLDQDGDPNNGILISDAVRQIAANWIQPDFTASDLPNELVMIIADAASVDGTPHNLPDEPTAQAHLEDELACAYAGAFAGPFTGTNNGAMTMLVGWGAPGFGFRPRGFDWNGFDPDEEFFVGGGGFPLVNLSARPTIDTTGDPTIAGPINAVYMTPDRISGTWAFPPENSSGSFDIARIGGSSGMYRLIGALNAFEVGAVMALDLSGNTDGSTVTGQAFDRVSAEMFEVTGVLTQGQLAFEATNGTDTASGIGPLTFDANGLPNDVLGQWALSDGSVSGDFALVGCKLN